jgi:hypothetical protein
MNRFSQFSKRTTVATAMAIALGGAAQPQIASAAVYSFEWTGLFTMLGTNGQPFTNSSAPYSYDPTWGYGQRTQVSGTFQYDTDTGEGTMTVEPFDFFANNGLGPAGAATATGISFEEIGDGAGGAGNLLLGNMLFDWGGNDGIPVSIVWDATGLINALGAINVGDTVTGVGVTPASDGVKNNVIPIGVVPVATTGWDTTTIKCIPGGGGTGDCMGVAVTGALPLLVGATYATGNMAGQMMGGSPMVAGPFEANMMNFDITTMTVTSRPHPPEIPVPAAAWLFGTGLIGLFGVARRKAAR